MTLGLWIVGMYLTAFALLSIGVAWFRLRKRARTRYQRHRRFQAHSQAFN